MITRFRELFQGQKVLIGAICCALLLALALRLWRAGTRADWKRRGPAGETEQQRADKSEKAAEPSDPNQTQEQQNSNGAERSDGAAGANTEPESPASIQTPENKPEDLTTSTPKGLIVIDSPHNREVILGPRFVLSGKANVFENAIFYEVKDTDGRQWVAGATHASGKWGIFSLTVDLRNSRYMTEPGGGPRQLTLKIRNDPSQSSEMAILTVTVVP